MLAVRSQIRRTSGHLHVKQPPHWSAPVVGKKSLKESAKSNS